MLSEIIEKKCTNKWGLNSETYKKALEIIDTYIKKLLERPVNQYNIQLDHLLVVAEIFDILVDKEKWANYIFNSMRNITSKIKYNQHSLGMGLFGGLTNYGMIIHCIRSEIGGYKNLALSYNQFFNKSLQIWIQKICKKENSLRIKDYDSVWGACGIVIYLLQIESEEAVLYDLVRYLVEITQVKIVKGTKVPGWYIDQVNQINEEDKKKYTMGSFNYGISHGIAGPLFALSVAWEKGIRVEGHLEAIGRILAEYKKVARNENEILFPTILSFEDYANDNFTLKEERMSWCYGKISILLSILKACEIKKDYKNIGLVCNEFRKILLREINSYELLSPILCHGYAGVMVEYMVLSEKYQIENLNIRIVNLANKIIENYSSESKYGFYDVQQELNNVFYVDDDSLLGGTSGIILSLIKLVKGTNYFEKFMMIDA